MAQQFFHLGFTLWLEKCCACGTRFAMSDEVHGIAMQRNKDFMFHCPNGHSQYYKSNKQISEEEETRRERDRLRQKVAELNDEAASYRVAATRAKKEVARIKKRVEGGVCPCCDRTFANLAAHMRSKHGGPAAAKREAAKHKAEA